MKELSDTQQVSKELWLGYAVKDAEQKKLYILKLAKVIWLVALFLKNDIIAITVSKIFEIDNVANS